MPHLEWRQHQQQHIIVHWRSQATLQCAGLLNNSPGILCHITSS